MLNRKKAVKQKLIDQISTLIAHGVEIHGDLYVKNGIQIDGHVTGNIEARDSESLVRVTETGSVKGHIKGVNIIINGRVEGDVYSAEYVELAEKAFVLGSVHYNLIEMTVGAEVNGSLIHEENNDGSSSDLREKSDIKSHGSGNLNDF